MFNLPVHSKQSSSIKSRVCKTHNKYYKKCQKCNDYKHYKNTCLEVNETAQELSSVASCSSQNNNVKNCSSTSQKFKQYLKNSKACKFCYESDHSETDCYQKFSQDYYSKYCHYCEEHGHIEDTCPLVEKATRDLKQQYPKTSFDDRKQSKHLKESIRTRKNLSSSKLCSYCKKFYHDESECIIKEQTEYYRKYCHYCEKNGHFEDACPLVEQAAEEQSTYCKSETDCCQKVEQDYYSKYCHYCAKHGHFEDTCPLVGQTAKVQSTYVNKKENEKKLLNKQTKGLKNVCEYCDESDHSESECKEKILNEGLNEYCYYCEEYGHCEDTCPLIEKAKKHFKKLHQNNSFDNYKQNKHSKESVKIRKNPASSKLCSYCKKFYHNESECFAKQQTEYYSKYCHYCDKNGHSDDSCPLVQQAAKEQSTSVYTKNNRKKVPKNTIKKSSDLKNLKGCNFCHESDHSETDCYQKMAEDYYGKYCHYCEEHGHFEDTCPLVEKAAKEQSSTCVYKKKNKKKISNNKVQDTNAVKTLKACNFCDESDHSETDCYQKMAQDYYGKYCHYCEEHGHFEDTCPLVKQAVKEQSTYVNKKENKKKFANNKTKGNNVLENGSNESSHRESESREKVRYEDYISKYCQYCEEYGHVEDACELVKYFTTNFKKQARKNSSFNNSKQSNDFKKLAKIRKCNVCDDDGHDEKECFVKKQSEYDSKYCYYCKENGHFEDTCSLLQQVLYEQSTSRRSRRNIKKVFYRRIQ